MCLSRESNAMRSYHLGFPNYAVPAGTLFPCGRRVWGRGFDVVDEEAGWHYYGGP